MIIRSFSKKFASYPTAGVYYAVPAKNQTNWILMSLAQRDPTTGKHLISEGEACHHQLFIDVIQYFKTNFNIDIEGIGKRCLPRGRIEQKQDQWKILHGNDTPFFTKNQIIDEFGLHSVNPKFEYWEFQSMLDRDQERLFIQAPFVKEMLETTETIL